jgi:hypothetical protein
LVLILVERRATAPTFVIIGVIPTRIEAAHGVTVKGRETTGLVAVVLLARLTAGTADKVRPRRIASAGGCVAGIGAVAVILIPSGAAAEALIFLIVVEARRDAIAAEMKRDGAAGWIAIELPAGTRGSVLANARPAGENGPSRIFFAFEGALCLRRSQDTHTSHECGEQCLAKDRSCRVEHLRLLLRLSACGFTHKGSSRQRQRLAIL